LIGEARKMLKKTKYKGLDIIIDENINPKILAILEHKFNKGGFDAMNELERIIANVVSFYIGNMHRPPQEFN
jgi:hypothetical protein